MINQTIIMLRRHGFVVTLPHEIVELILSRLAVKSLLRFKCVSKKWKSTIESLRFKEAQLRQSQQSRDPDILYVMEHNHDITEYEEEARIPVLGSSSSVIRMAKFPYIPNATVCYGSCDGLVCLFSYHTPNMVANPATRWHQSFPLSRAQQLHSNMCKYTLPPSPQLGFGKDKFTGTYKPVWLCNSSEFGLLNNNNKSPTTCEVFDFSTNAWRYVLPASPYRILDRHKPVCFDGSLYWLTECTTKLLSFDLHTETFQVICKPPFSDIPEPQQVVLCILDNSLCVSQRNWPTQVIWSLQSNTSSWKEMCTIDLTKTFSLPEELPYYPLPVALPLALLEKKNKLLFGPAFKQPMVIHDLHTKSYHQVFSPPVGVFGYPVPHFDTLFSLSPN